MKVVHRRSKINPGTNEHTHKQVISAIADFLRHSDTLNSHKKKREQIRHNRNLQPTFTTAVHNNSSQNTKIINEHHDTRYQHHRDWPKQQG
mmetsp:Transcript_39053/g.94434  ORF Transcript_39053/g.94434 Transcript_39053/m.94434 type:complete len:91 (+) Transcript_39053:923-1195(+)